MPAVFVPQVRSLTGVDCNQGPQFCELLLQAVAKQLEELELLNPGMQHMEVAKTMPSLRKLSAISSNANVAVAAVSQFPANLEELCIKPATVEHLWLVKELKALRKLDVVCEDYLDVTSELPGLPSQLEELKLRRCSRQHLSSIERMPRLRRLCLDGIGIVRGFSFAQRRPPLHCGLSCLELATPREELMFSLIHAHSDTLQEIRLVLSCRGGKPYIPDLADGFHDCVFLNLKRLVLLRRHDWWHPNHDVDSCRQQVHELRDALRCTDAVGGFRDVPVLCDTCDYVLPL